MESYKSEVCSAIHKYVSNNIRNMTEGGALVFYYREVMRPVHPWASNLTEVIELYMHRQVPRHMIMPYIYICTMRYYLMEMYDVKCDCMSVLYSMYGKYPNISNMNEVLSSIVDYACCHWIYGNDPLLSLAANREAQRVFWDRGTEVMANEQLLYDAIRNLLTIENNARISPLYIVWDENYHNEECMTTWLPREMMEDVVWLTGKGTTYV